MRLSSAIKILPRCIGKNSLLDRLGIIFLFGHMRCFSSLLGHMIGSHPQVAGCGEMHQKYRGMLDLIELASKIENYECHSPVGRYLFDKILQNLEIRDCVLNRDDLSVILMSRPPEPTIQSILKISAGGIVTADAAINYYIARMQMLQQIVERRKGRVIYLDADLLIEEPADTLRSLSKSLGLTPDISENYELFPKTGIGKHGDPSPWIKMGKIVKDRDQAPSPSALPSEIDNAIKAYADLRKFCGQHAEIKIMHS